MSSMQFTVARPIATARLGVVRIALAALVATAVGCTTAPPLLSSRPITANTNVDNAARRARDEHMRGNYAEAAAAYSQLALATSGAQRTDYLLEAARAYLAAGDAATARSRVLDARAGVRPEQQPMVVALSARLEAEQGRPQAALDMLAGLTQPLGTSVRQEAAAARGRAYFKLGRPAEGVGALAEREVWLDNAAAVRANQQMIWDGLREPTVPEALAPVGDPIVDGWLALAPFARRGGDAAELRGELAGWRATYANHPAAGGLLADLLSMPRGATSYPRQIALLLPLSSPLRAAAVALRDGFLAAYLGGASGVATSVRVYDTGELGATDAYARAQADGAQFIVGPLLRGEVEEIMPQAGFVPTLALNFAQTQTAFAGKFYQFALAPADEARTVAQHAAAEGLRTAVALVPSTERGYQLRDAFRAEFEALGGELIDFSGYDPAMQDFSGPITSMFNIGRSTQRYRRLAANLGTAIQFEPRRRADVDAIFLLADSGTARLIAPQLRYNGVGGLPLYATTDIFDPGASTRDGDLNGVIYPDLPVVLAPDAQAAALRSELQAYWPQRGGQIRFYGMGFDAYRLVGQLYSDNGFWPVSGLTGDLTLDVDGRIHRSLPLAQFRDGLPVAIETATSSSEVELGLVGFR